MAPVVLRRAALWLSLATLPWPAACSAPDAFTCAADAQCMADGAAGRCEPEGVCSFPDGACDSGHRYGAYSGELSGVCVGAGSSGIATDVGMTSVSPEGTDASDGSSSGPSATSMTPVTSTTSTASTTEPETTDGDLDPYGKCVDDTECHLEGSFCATSPKGNTVCVPPCNDAPCVDAGRDVGPPLCLPAVNGMGCVLLCESPDECLAGMTCDLSMGVGFCAWPP